MIPENIKDTHILQAIEFLKKNGIQNARRNSNKVDLLFENETYPPKLVISKANEYANGKELDSGLFVTNEAQKHLKKEGFRIINKSEIPSTNGSMLYPQIKKYQDAIDNTDWLKVHEIYKFKFIKWIEDNVDFENDSNEELKQKIFDSQQIAYSPGNRTKGVNFIQTIIRYQDDYVTVEDVEKLKKILRGDLEDNKENLTLSFGSFPKTSAFLSLFSPEKYIAYDGESIPAYEFLSKNNSDYEAPPKRDYKAFKFYQLFYQNIKTLLKESHLNVTIFKELLGVDSLTELQWNFIAQDFLLFITRKIMKVDTLQKKYDSFIEREQFQTWDWYKDLKKYTDVINLIKASCVASKYSTYAELNEDFRNLSANDKGDFLERYLFMSSNGFSTIRNQLIKHDNRRKIRQKISGNFTLLSDILIEKDINRVFKITHKLIEGNNWTVIYRFLRALFPNKLTSVDSPNHFEFLVKKLNRDFNITLKANNQIDKNLEVLNEINYEDIYEAQIFFWMYRIENTSNNPTQSEDTEYTNMDIKFPLNQILYGAPGTGKTYLTKKLAVEIINGNKFRNREEILDEYEILKKLNQIQFTTFHQSMSYEDFVEGIRPEEQDGKIIYEKKSGIFKELCNTAKATSSGIDSSHIDFDNCDYYKMSLGGLQSLEKHQWSLENDLIFLGWGHDKDFTDFKQIKDWNKFRDKFKKDFPELVSESKYVIQAVFIFQKMKVGDIVLISKGNKIIDAVGIIESDYFYDDSQSIDHYQFRKVKWLAKDLNLNSNVFVDKGISQQTIYEFYKADIKKDVLKELFNKEKSSVPNKYVLIIDEINRGNISAIFGELITLLEEDKRKGVTRENKEYIEVVLPYSNELFSVPDNLYIIGTMNTADRSVEALDTALRRRFSFIEMQPSPDLLIPQEIIYNTLWDFKNIGWDNEEWLNAETGLNEIFNFNEDWDTEKHKLWEEFKIKKYDIQDSEKLLDLFNPNIDLASLLSTINNRIEYLIDKDHQIGHSYLFKVRSLRDLIDVFKDKILPLLEEYFYGDFGKIGLVLGDTFVVPKDKKDKNVLAQNFSYGAEFIEEKDLFEFVNSEDWDIETFTSIYA